jgi:serine/threonine-protein kinase RsbW
MGHRDTYRLEMPSEHASIRRIDPFLRSHDLDVAAGARYHDVLVVITEAVTNAVVHGNADVDDASITMEVEFESGELQVTVYDKGSGFDADALPDPRLPENLLREGGRGVFLMKQLADSVEFVSQEGGSFVVIHFTLQT